MRPGATPTPEPKSPWVTPARPEASEGAGPRSSQPRRHSVWRHPPCLGVCGTLLLNSGFDFVTLEETQGLVGASEAPKTPPPTLWDRPIPGVFLFPGRAGGLPSLEICRGGRRGWRQHYERCACVCVCARAHVCMWKVQFRCPPACKWGCLRPRLTRSPSPRAIAGVDHECLKSGLFPRPAPLCVAGPGVQGAGLPTHPQPLQNMTTAPGQPPLF